MSAESALKTKRINLEDLAEQLKVLGDKTRLELVRSIAETQDAQACVCDLTPATGLTQGTVSHHLKLLVEAGILNRTQSGKWAYYSITQTAHNLLSAIGLEFNPTKSKKTNC